MISKAKEGESHTVYALFTDGDGVPYSVSNVQATLFYYVQGEKTILSGPSLMLETEDSYRYLTAFAIPSGTAGKTLFVTVTASRTSDDLSVVYDQSILVDDAIDEQRMRVTFVP